MAEEEKIVAIKSDLWPGLNGVDWTARDLDSGEFTFGESPTIESAYEDIKTWAETLHQEETTEEVRIERVFYDAKKESNEETNS